MLLPRLLNLNILLKNKSFFLFGPRATGKSSLIKQQFDKNTLVIDLLRSDIYLQLSAKPFDLEPMIDAFGDPKQVVIDEVQRVPMLLNEVHRMIENRGIRFLLTGSSARSLKKSHVNLLAGRAWEAHLYPLTQHEIPEFDLMRYLQFGGLPSVYLSRKPTEELHAYVNTYLREEIQAESLVRKIPAFSQFLQTAALCSGNILNYTEVASDTGIPVATIREYYHILEDTFIGFTLPAWTKTKKRKAASTGKFYVFDLGVRNTLMGLKQLSEKSKDFGDAFEHFIILECQAYLSYRRHHLPLSHWRTKHGHEVDLLIADDIAIEIKATEKVSDKHLKGLKLLEEENIIQQYFLVSQDPIARRYGNIMVIHWKDFLEKLWNDELIH